MAVPVPGSGARLSARTGVDALERVANRPIVHHVLDALHAAGADEIVVAAPQDHADAVRACVTRWDDGSRCVLHYVEERSRLDFADVLRLAAPIVGAAPCMVHAADGLLGEPLVPIANRLREPAPDLLLFAHHGSAPEGHLSPDTKEVLRLAELDPERLALEMAGVCVFGPGALSRASAAAWDSAGEADLTTVAGAIGAAGGTLQVHLVDGWGRYAGDAIDLLGLNRIALDRLGPNRQPSTNGNRIEGRVHIHETASVHESVIVGPTVIGPGAHICDAYIGPYTSIGSRARIEGSEIERSIVCSGASILYIGSRLVASVVGRDARVHRDLSLPRALRLRIGDGTEVALC